MKKKKRLLSPLEMKYRRVAGRLYDVESRLEYLMEKHEEITKEFIPLSHMWKRHQAYLARKRTRYRKMKKEGR